MSLDICYAIMFWWNNYEILAWANSRVDIFLKKNLFVGFKIWFLKENFLFVCSLDNDEITSFWTKQHFCLYLIVSRHHRNKIQIRAKISGCRVTNTVSRRGWLCFCWQFKVFKVFSHREQQTKELTLYHLLVFKMFFSKIIDCEVNKCTRRCSE